jgi:uncharacterized protein (DUF1330 family)
MSLNNNLDLYFFNNFVIHDSIIEMNMIDKLFEYYRKNQAALVEKYSGKYLVITSDNVEPYDNEMEAYSYAVGKYGLGNFILQLCTSGEQSYSQHFFTARVAF